MKELLCQNVEKLTQRQENLEDLSDRTRKYIHYLYYYIGHCKRDAISSTVDLNGMNFFSILLIGII